MKEKILDLWEELKDSNHTTEYIIEYIADILKIENSLVMDIIIKNNFGGKL